MKKLLLFLILSLIIISSATRSFGQELLNTSFEDYTEGSVFGQDDWIEDNDNDGSAEVVSLSSYAHTGSKGLQMSSSTAVETIVDHQSYSKDETGLSANVYFDLWIKLISSPSESAFIRVFDHLPDNGIRRAVEIRMYPEGDIKISNGGSKVEVPANLYTVGDWIRISMNVDYATSKYEVAVNGTVLSQFFDFRESYEPADKDRPSGIKEYHGLRFWYEDAIGDIAIDDMYIGTDAIGDIAFTAPSTDRTIAVTQPENATITLNPNQAIYQVGDVVSATIANVAEHYVFDGWTGSFSGTDNPLSITVAGNVSLGADVIIDVTDPPAEFTIDITQPTGGTITVDPVSGPYYEGATVEFTVSADIGYTFESWTGITGTETSVEVEITENLVVSANMVLGTFTKRTVNVSNTDELEDTMRNMLPGDSIVLADGTYNDVNRSVELLGGTAEYPVYIIAANQGMAKLRGESNFTFENCAYITVRGLDIEVDEVNNIFKLVDCNNVRICYNRISSTKSDGSSKWIDIGGEWEALECFSHHNRVDHNLLEGKLDGGALLIIGGNSGTNDVACISQYDRIDHNHFKNIGPRVTNEKETIRVGYSKLSLQSAYTSIEYNLFEECDGDPEIISIKSNDNFVRNNTFRRSLGTVSLRHGNRTEVSGNFFFGEGKTAEFDGGTIGCGGVRVYGKDHKIFNNYFEGLTGSRWDAVCTLTQGDASNDGVTQGSDLTKHYVIENLEFTHNTLINNTSDIEIGYRDDWGKAPINVLIANNIIIQDTNPVTKVHYAGTDDDVAFADNIIYTSGTGSFGDIAFTSSEASNVDPLLEQTKCKIPEAGCTGVYANAIYKISGADSPALDPTPVNTIPEVMADIEGQGKVGTRDLGADEYNSSDVITNGAVDDRHVGPDAVPFTSETPPEEFTITLIQSAGGAISVSPATGPYYAGSTVTFSAVPDTDFFFASWSGISGTDEVQEISITSNLTVEAEFTNEPVTGVLQESLARQVSVFPNPFESSVVLESKEQTSVTIYTVDGAFVDSFEFRHHYKWTAPSPGLYIGHISTNEQKVVLKLMAK